jgi:hypothetical protein
MFDEFTYKDFHVRAGVRQSRTDGGRWYGMLSLAHDSLEVKLSLADRLFDWPAEARRHAARRAKELIDERLSGHEQAHEDDEPAHSDSQRSA